MRTTRTTDSQLLCRLWSLTVVPSKRPKNQRLNPKIGFYIQPDSFFNLNTKSTNQIQKNRRTLNEGKKTFTKKLSSNLFYEINFTLTHTRASDLLPPNLLPKLYVLGITGNIFYTFFNLMHKKLKNLLYWIQSQILQ